MGAGQNGPFPRLSTKSSRPWTLPARRSLRRSRRRPDDGGPHGTSRLARSQLPARDAGAPGRGRYLLGRPSLYVPVGGAKALARAVRRARPHRADVAEGIWRRKLYARGRRYPQGGNAAHSRPAAAGQLRHLDAWPGVIEIWLARAEGDALAAHCPRRNSLVSGLFGTWGRLRSRFAAHESGGPWRSLSRQRAEDLDLVRRQSRLDLLPRAHRPSGGQAEGHFLPSHRHGYPGRLDETDRAHLRQVAVLRNVLRQCRGSEGEF